MDTEARRKSFASAGDRTPVARVVQSVARYLLTELPRLLHKDMTLHNIIEFYIAVCPNITSKFRTIAMFKSHIKENL
jgi:hypothetical protein